MLRLNPVNNVHTKPLLNFLHQAASCEAAIQVFTEGGVFDAFHFLRSRMEPCDHGNSSTYM